jgi:ABC-type lipoprotein release transport system permease subunit
MDIATIFLETGLGWIVEIYNSFFFSVVKFILAIYAIVIFVNIVLLLIQRGLSGDIKDTIYGMNLPAELVSKKKVLREKWKRIRGKLEIDNESAWKVAIIEADNLIDDLLKRMGYAGENFGERLAGINPGQIENVEDLKKAHETRNRIIHEENFKLEKEQAEEVLGYYEDFLKYFEVLD